MVASHVPGYCPTCAVILTPVPGFVSCLFFGAVCLFLGAGCLEIGAGRLYFGTGAILPLCVVFEVLYNKHSCFMTNCEDASLQLWPPSPKAGVG